MIRMIGGLASVLALDPPWLYPASTWLSWLAPLVVLEAVHFLPASGQRKLAGEFER